MYNIGIVGSSFISEQFIESARTFDSLNVLALYSRTKEKGLKFIKGNNINKLYTDYNELLLDDSIDIIYIASPNSLHYKQALSALSSGKHVILEKPATLHSFELEALYNKAREHNVLFMEAIVSIHYNTFNKTIELIKKIGDIHYVNFTLQQQTRHYNDYKNKKFVNVFSKEMGGGALRDLGPYLLYPLVYFFGVPQNVDYFPIYNSDNIDESTSLVCSYQKYNVILSTSKLVADKRENIISGTDGYITIGNINEFNTVKLFDIEGNLLEHFEADYNNRMDDEIQYFLNLLNNKEEINQNFVNNSISINKIIENNYK